VTNADGSVSLTYAFRGTNEATNAKDAQDTAQELCKAMLSAVKKKALTGFARYRDRFVLSYKPWGDAAQVQQEQTEELAARADWNNWTSIYFKPGVEFTLDVLMSAPGGSLLQLAGKLAAGAAAKTKEGLGALWEAAKKAAEGATTRIWLLVLLLGLAYIFFNRRERTSK
jgi:hypothetical protein